MSDFNTLKPVEKRNKILDYLNANPEGVTFGELRAALGANKSISTTLNVMLLRDEVGQSSRVGNVVKWVALVKVSRAYRFGPEPAKKANSEPHKEPHVTTVRLLDKPASQTGSGGQAVRRDYTSMQCGFIQRSVAI